MAQPGDTIPLMIRVTDGAGSGIAGLLIDAFTVTARGRGYGASTYTTYSCSPSLIDLGGGDYVLNFTMPVSAGWFSLRISHATYDVRNDWLWGEVELTDSDALYGVVARGVATDTSGVQMGTQLPLVLAARRFRTLAIPILDLNKNPYNFASLYPDSSLRMSVRSQNQTTTVWDAGPTNTPTGFSISGSGNILSITIPENAAFFSALAAGADSVALFYEVTGDLSGTATQTQPIICSSPLTLTRSEVP